MVSVLRFVIYTTHIPPTSDNPLGRGRRGDPFRPGSLIGMVTGTYADLTKLDLLVATRSGFVPLHEVMQDEAKLIPCTWSTLPTP